ncbi:hypothetical protein MVEN_01815700 [Mycena venus]|uniref:Uncharacterized protein n=1 Tax=Mycena venus TaxID=2733690 RepID=A0A8H6XKS7_9AGAR|nr:hypothetical protein MVEN_01815700 [Mycena venus]
MPYGSEDSDEFMADLRRLKANFLTARETDLGRVLNDSDDYARARMRVQNALLAENALQRLGAAANTAARQEAWMRVDAVLTVGGSSPESRLEQWRASGRSIIRALAALLPPIPAFLSQAPSTPTRTFLVAREPHLHPSLKRDHAQIGRSLPGSPEKPARKKRSSTLGHSPLSPTARPPPRWDGPSIRNGAVPFTPNGNCRRSMHPSASNPAAVSPEKKSKQRKRTRPLLQSPYQTPPAAKRQRPAQPAAISSFAPLTAQPTTGPSKPVFLSPDWLPTQPAFHIRSPRHRGPPSRPSTLTHRRRRSRSRSRSSKVQQPHRVSGIDEATEDESPTIPKGADVSSPGDELDMLGTGLLPSPVIYVKKKGKADINSLGDELDMLGIGLLPSPVLYLKKKAKAFEKDVVEEDEEDDELLLKPRFNVRELEAQRVTPHSKSAESQPLRSRPVDSLSIDSPSADFPPATEAADRQPAGSNAVDLVATVKDSEAVDSEVDAEEVAVFLLGQDDSDGESESGRDGGNATATLRSPRFTPTSHALTPPTLILPASNLNLHPRPPPSHYTSATSHHHTG